MSPILKLFLLCLLPMTSISIDSWANLSKAGPAPTRNNCIDLLKNTSLSKNPLSEHFSTRKPGMIVDGFQNKSLGENIISAFKSANIPELTGPTSSSKYLGNIFEFKVEEHEISFDDSVLTDFEGSTSYLNDLRVQSSLQSLMFRIPFRSAALQIFQNAKALTNWLNSTNESPDESIGLNEVYIRIIRNGMTSDIKRIPNSSNQHFLAIQTLYAESKQGEFLPNVGPSIVIEHLFKEDEEFNTRTGDLLLLKGTHSLSFTENFKSSYISRHHSPIYKEPPAHDGYLVMIEMSFVREVKLNGRKKSNFFFDTIPGYEYTRE